MEQEEDLYIEKVDMPMPAIERGENEKATICLSVPQNRFTPLKKNWDKICQVVIERCKLNIRMNPAKKTVELRESESTTDSTILQKAADFVKAFLIGFSFDDAIALLRIDDLFIETFLIKDVKTLKGDHLSRCVARISGEKGKTKNAVQNATRTRIVLADTRIHIMGSFQNIRSARSAICNLIIGSPAGKVYSQLRYVSKRLQQRF